MKKMFRVLCAVLALTMLLTAVGCSAPKLTLGGTPDVAGTVDGEELSTGEYLAYLYNSFYNVYYNQGYYQYESYGYDVWGQKMPYGDDKDAAEVTFSEYLRLMTKDEITRQAAMRRLLKKYDLSWDKDELKELEDSVASMEADAYLSLGISDENYVKVNKELMLNERALFFGLYGEGGTKAVAQKEIRKYFDENYLSFKIISIPLTDDKGKELDAAGKKKITDQLNGYLESYNKDKNFEAVVDAYAKSQAAEGEKITPSKDEDNRVNVDATQLGDDELEKAIRGVKEGKAKVVTYTASGEKTPTAALILRLDINDPKTLFEDETENILYMLKYEEFDKEVTGVAANVPVELKNSVVKKCLPENFLEAMQ